MREVVNLARVNTSCFHFQESLNLPYFFIEDVYMGGWTADRCMVPKKQLEGFSPGKMRTH